MSELPTGWVAATIGDTGQYINGMAFKPVDWGDEGLPIIRIQNLTDRTKEFNLTKRDYDQKYLVSNGDILVSWSASLDVFIWDRGDALLNQHIFKVVPEPDLVSDRYLYYVLQRAIEELRSSEHLHGSTMKHINRGPFLAHGIVIPPRQEQDRIVAKLDGLMSRLFCAREELAHVPGLVERYKQSILSAAFNGGLTELRRSDDLPENWQWVNLSDVAHDFSYGTSSKSAKTGSVPVLRMGNIRDGKLDWTDLVYTSDIEQIDKYRLSPGDILFNRTNSPALVGKTAMYSEEEEAIYAGYLIRIRCGDELLPEYLTYCLNSPIGRAFCWEVKSDAVSQSNISATKLKTFRFPLAPLGEQRQILDIVDRTFTAIDRLVEEHDIGRKRLEQFEQSILAMVFRGELVAQDPNDEPASDLLDRIRKQTTEPSIPARKRQVRGSKVVQKLSRERIVDWINAQSGGEFTFDVLRNELGGEYEDLVELVFGLLSEADGPLVQKFDGAERGMIFVRRTQ